MTVSVCYTIVLTVSGSSTKRTSITVLDTPRTSRDISLQRKISLIILSDFTCWVPFIVICLLHFSAQIDGSSFYEFCSIILLPINSVINPIIYNNEFGRVRSFINRAVTSVSSVVRINTSTITEAAPQIELHCR